MFGNVFSKFFVLCDSKKESSRVKRIIESVPGANMFVHIEGSNPNKLYIRWLFYVAHPDSTGSSGDFKKAIEAVYAELFRKTGKRIEGYVTEDDFRGFCYRGEFDKDGQLNFVASVNQAILAEMLTNSQLTELHSYIWNKYFNTQKENKK